MVPYDHYTGLVKIKSVRNKEFWFYEGKTDFMVFVNVTMWCSIYDCVPKALIKTLDVLKGALKIIVLALS